VTKEAFGGQHIDSQKSFDERKKHQINSYFKDIISTVNESDELYILDLQKQKTNFNKKSMVKKSTIASKLKSVETADSMTSNQITK
jgi:hypothetical protein